MTTARKHDQAPTRPRNRRAPAQNYSAMLVKENGRTFPLVRGWTVDLRGREFRRVDPTRGQIIVPLDSPEGQALFALFLVERYTK